MLLKWTDLNASQQSLVKHNTHELFHIMWQEKDAEVVLPRLNYVLVHTLFQNYQEGGLQVVWSSAGKDDNYISANQTDVPPEKCVVAIHSHDPKPWIEVATTFKDFAELPFLDDPELADRYPVQSSDPALKKVIPFIMSLLVYPEDGQYHPYSAYDDYVKSKAAIERHAPEAYVVLTNGLHDVLVRRQPDNHEVTDEAKVVSKLSQLLKS